MASQQQIANIAAYKPEDSQLWDWNALSQGEAVKGTSSINQKTLNYEIETVSGSMTDRTLTESINQKTLNYEIETE